MIHLLDATLEQYLRSEVPLDDRVDIAYNAPDDEWSSRLTRPTVNLFVWDIRRNIGEAAGGIDLVEQDGD
ncbi:MAG: Pvc16 family protein, partial [Dehalococcoidia bacterium]|nr:Pvc16 family protein [Dehalococcoidia bacterium]